ncbi:hypothetical protein ABZ853_28280 [Streptomyces albidoflavus]
MESGPRPVRCLECGNEVLVEKRSLAHTSVQWTRPSARCPEIGPRGAEVRGCARLRASIEGAVRDGALRVGPSDEE